MTGWRHIVLAGFATGLGAAPLVPPPPLGAAGALILIALASLALLGCRPVVRTARLHWLAAVAAVAALAGLHAGDGRVAAIDGAAYAGDPGARVSVRGFVSGFPRRQNGLIVVPVDTADGLLAVEAPEPERELRVGGEIRADGPVRLPEPWLRPQMRIAGVARIVTAASIEPTGRGRRGIAGAVDEIRDRAEAALDRGVPSAEAALARGFVLGEDDRIDPATVDDFRRSGLAHLLAVSARTSSFSPCSPSRSSAFSASLCAPASPSWSA